MSNLLDKIQLKYPFSYLDEVVIKGYSKSIVLQKFFLDVDDEMKLILSEMHQNNEVLQNEFRLSITDIDDDYLNHCIDFFEFSDEQKLFSFLEFFVK